MQSSPVSRRSLDDLEEELVSLAARINAAEYEFLVLVREFDIRQGWRAWHFNNCAEWMNFRCGISLGTAREKVRVAMQLLDLPQMSKAFADGALSYSKVRALTRVATPRNEEELVAFAVPQTVTNVEEYCRRKRNGQLGPSTEDANRVHRRRWLSCTRNEDGGMHISIDLTREAGELVMKAVEMAMVSGARDQAVAVESDDKDSYFAMQADALVDVARGYLASDAPHSNAAADHYQVMVHVDQSALMGEDGASDLPLESVRRITCDASLVAVTEDEDGTPLDVGRKHRIVSPSLKRVLLARDKTCRFPGCCHDKWLDAHHVMHWSEGGETNLDNLIILCARHHRLLHEGGYTIHKDFEGNWYFRHANGRVIPRAAVYREAGDEGQRDPSRDGSGARPINADEVREPPALYLVA
jgi:hypothetical protein